MNNMNKIDYFVDCVNYECYIIINDNLNNHNNILNNHNNILNNHNNILNNHNDNLNNHNNILNNFDFYFIFYYFKIILLFIFTVMLSFIYVGNCLHYPSIKKFENLYKNNKDYYDYDPFFFECLQEFYNLKNQKLSDKDLKKLKKKFIKKDTKFGTIILNYDYKNQSFNYYTKKSNSIPFEYLEVISRIYVVQFNCKSIYIDFYENEENEENEETEENEEYEESDIFYKKTSTKNKLNSNLTNNIITKNKYKYKGNIQRFINLNKIYKYYIYNIDSSNLINNDSNNDSNNYFFFKLVTSKNNSTKSINNQNYDNQNYDNQNYDNQNYDNQNYDNDFNKLNILNNIDLNDSEELEKYFCSDLDYSSFEEDIEEFKSDNNNNNNNNNNNSKLSFKEFKKNIKKI